MVSRLILQLNDGRLTAVAMEGTPQGAILDLVGTWSEVMEGGQDDAISAAFASLAPGLRDQVILLSGDNEKVLAGSSAEADKADLVARLPDGGATARTAIGKSAVDEASSRASKWGVTMKGLGSQTLARTWLVSRLLASSEQRILLVHFHTDRTAFSVLGATGLVDHIEVAGMGVDLLVGAVQKAFNLRFAGAASRLLLKPNFEFGEASKAIGLDVATRFEPTKTELEKKGPLAGVICAGAIADPHWLELGLAEAWKIPVWAPSTSESLVKAQLTLGSGWSDALVRIAVPALGGAHFFSAASRPALEQFLWVAPPEAAPKPAVVEAPPAVAAPVVVAPVPVAAAPVVSPAPAAPKVVVSETSVPPKAVAETIPAAAPAAVVSPPAVVAPVVPVAPVAIPTVPPAAATPTPATPKKPMPVISGDATIPPTPPVAKPVPVEPAAAKLPAVQPPKKEIKKEVPVARPVTPPKPAAPVPQPAKVPPAPVPPPAKVPPAPVPVSAALKTPVAVESPEVAGANAKKGNKTGLILTVGGLAAALAIGGYFMFGSSETKVSSVPPPTVTPPPAPAPTVSLPAPVPAKVVDNTVQKPVVVEKPSVSAENLRQQREKTLAANVQREIEKRRAEATRRRENLNNAATESLTLASEFEQAIVQYSAGAFTPKEPDLGGLRSRLQEAMDKLAPKMNLKKQGSIAGIAVPSSTIFSLGMGNGQFKSGGRSPSVPPGFYSVTVSAEGYESQQIRVRVQPGELKIMDPVVLKPLTRVLRIETPVTNGACIVYRIGEGGRLPAWAGHIPTVTPELPMGHYAVRFFAPGWPVYEKEIDLEIKEVDLSDPSAEEMLVVTDFPGRTVSVSADPAGSAVYLAGQVVASGLPRDIFLPLKPEGLCIDHADYLPEPIQALPAGFGATKMMVQLISIDPLKLSETVDAAPVVLSGPLPVPPKGTLSGPTMVTARFVVRFDGAVASVELPGATIPPAAVQACIQSLSGWMFTPATLRGHAITTRIDVPIELQP